MSDFHVMLDELGISEARMSELTAIETDRIPMPEDHYKFEIAKSPIHGKGVFAFEHYDANEVIGAVRVGLSQTPLGYRTNHSGTPNAETVGLPDGGGYMRTLRPIAPGEEITIDYRSAIVQANKAEHQILASEGVQRTFSELVAKSDAGADRMVLRSLIDNLEQELLKMPQADHGLEHLFLDGLYIRVAHIVHGTLFTTPTYREECILTVLKGRIAVITETGSSAVVAPAFTLTQPNTKRVIFALDDVVAHTVHPNPDNERDIAVLEARIYAASFNETEIEGRLL